MNYACTDCYQFTFKFHLWLLSWNSFPIHISYKKLWQSNESLPISVSRVTKNSVGNKMYMNENIHTQEVEKFIYSMKEKKTMTGT